jgi:hypothetical protein
MVFRLYPMPKRPRRRPVQLPLDFGPGKESLTAHARRAKAALSGHQEHDNVDLPQAPPKNAEKMD